MVHRVEIALLLACLLAPMARAADAFKAQREDMERELSALQARARKANAQDAPELWLQLAEKSRVPPIDFEMLQPALRDRLEHDRERAPRTAMYRDALAHLDPKRLAVLSSTLVDPDVNAAMVRALRARGRDAEAAAECRATLARWSPGDVPRVVEECKACRTVPFSIAAGPASHSVFSQWIASGGEDGGWPYIRGLGRGIGPGNWVGRTRVHTIAQALDVDSEVRVVDRETIGLVIGDPREERGMRAATLAAAYRIPFLALAPSRSARDSAISAVTVGARALVPRPGPETRARLLLAAARKAGASRIALLLPEEGGEVKLADALERTARGMNIAVVRIGYPSGRREHREDAARLRSSGANAVVFLGPGEESGDWLPFLRSGMLVLGTDELDPSGFHESARRALEGAILVRARYTPADTTAGGWSESSAAEWIAGWAIGDAIAHGADSPLTLAKALEERATESDASDAWLAVPPEIARVEVLRVRGGRTETFR
jgi:hypothetical protein